MLCTFECILRSMDYHLNFSSLILFFSPWNTLANSFRLVTSSSSLFVWNIRLQLRFISSFRSLCLFVDCFLISIYLFIKFFLCYFKRFFFGLVWQPARSSVQRPRLVKLVHRVCVSRSSSSFTDSVLSNRNNIFYFQRRPRPHPVAPSPSVCHLRPHWQWATRATR